MITDELQYQVTNTQLEKLKTALSSFDDNINIAPLDIMRKAELEALESEIEILTLQVHEYQTLRSGTVDILNATTFEKLPKTLIRARIARGITPSQLADKLGLSELSIKRFEDEFYASANLDLLNKISHALDLNIREIIEFGISSIEPLESDTKVFAWDEFPVREMYQRGWFNDFFSGTITEAVNNAEELVQEFVSRSLTEPVRTAARQRVRAGGNINRYALTAWQCQAISLAKKIDLINNYNPENITENWLSQLVHLSREHDGPKRAMGFLKNAGVRLIIVPHLSQTHLDGAAFLLEDGSPIIAMTLRHDRLDNFWFVLLHELVHIIKHLHTGKLECIFDDLDSEANDIEQETDELAGEILVPAEKWDFTTARYVRSESAIKDFADELGVSPTIIAGKIRRETNNYIILNNIVGLREVRKLFPDIVYS